MRLPEAQIKQALLHPEPLVRESALQYFTDCQSMDVEVVTRAIEAIEKYGLKDAFWHITRLMELTPDEAAVLWAIEGLNREDAVEEFIQGRFDQALSGMLCRAEPRLIAKYGDAILDTCGFDADWIEQLEYRMEMDSWDADRLWREFECLPALGGYESPNFDFDRSRQIVSLLALRGDEYVPRILELLALDSDEREPLAGLKFELVELAGALRLPAAIPHLVRKLQNIRVADTDWDDEFSGACTEALAQIGTDAAALALTAEWLTFDDGYRFSATSALEGIHADATVRRCLDLLPQEPALHLQTMLANALLCQFDPDGLEPVLEMVRTDRYDKSMVDLMGKAAAVATVLGVEFPEREVWLADATVNRAERVERERDGWFALDAPDEDDEFDDEDGESLEDDREPEYNPAPVSTGIRDQDSWGPPQVPFVHADRQVGRNDPCPCGSGKKFKKCCLRENG